MTPAAEKALWTAEAASAATGGSGEGTWTATGVAIDSRAVEPGDLFVAIKGPRFDGHDFAADAFAAGAAAAVVVRRPDGVTADAPLVEVADTDRALSDLGRAARDRAQARVVAVTGSVGKTGTKEMLRLVLDDQAPTTASDGSLNNHWGVPLSLARMPADAAFGVFEIGMNHPGEIGPLARMAKPHVALVTNVEAVHGAFFDSVDAIADAKAEIFEGLEPDGTAVLNRDNAQFERLKAAAEAAGAGTIIGFGTDAEADVRATDVRVDSEGSDVDAVVSGAALAYRLGVPGRHWVMNSLAVLAAVGAAGGEVGPAAEAMARVSALKGRGRRHTVEMPDGSFVVIDESYNASPVAMNAAFQVLGQIQPEGGGRRIAVLGDMLELGDESAAGHAALVEGLIAERINLVFAAGPNMSALWDVLPRSMQGGNASSAARLEPLVKAAVRPGDVVLIKGSAGSRTGPIVDALLALGRPCGAGPDDRQQAVNG
ncbi:MAG: UDP-N-acetylmuramoylalanyl-D-glutamyl-2,6-diaminopimelate--D-alanyl-D-alanine ligase [Rhodospirillales bacterium]